MPSTIDASCFMSSADQVVPVGLCGVLTRIARVRGVIARRTSSQFTE